MERRKKLHIPEVPRQKVPAEVGEEQFQYLLRLLTTYENRNLTRTEAVLDELATYKNKNLKETKAVLDELAKYKNGVTTLSQTFLKMEQELAYIMKVLGYYDDPETGEFKRPVVPPRRDLKEGFAV